MTLRDSIISGNALAVAFIVAWLTRYQEGEIRADEIRGGLNEVDVRVAKPSSKQLSIAPGQASINDAQLKRRARLCVALPVSNQT
jgi:hypothetical protein